MWILALVGCFAQVELDGGGGGAVHEVADFGALHREWWTQAADDSGLVEVAVDVEADTTSFMATVTSDPRPMLRQIRDPSGAVVLDVEDWYGDHTLTGAFDGNRRTTAANWPIREVDGPLVPGRWTVVFDVAEPGLEVEVDAARKADPDLTHGVLTVRLAWAAGMRTPEASAAALEALATWADEWAPYGIEVVGTEVDTDLDPAMFFVANGDPAIRALAEAEAGAGELVMVIGSHVDIKPYVYGTSSGTPGPVSPSDYNFVAIAWDNVAGLDGVLNGDEIPYLGSIMAHEAAHYLGLTHPVESDWRTWDALDDTPECTAETSCEAQLGWNLMYPYANQGRDANDLTPEQVGVLQRYVGIL